MNSKVFSNNIMRRYIDYGSRMYLNKVRHDPNSSDEHKDKVEKICKRLEKEKIEFICRPVVYFNGVFGGWKNSLIPDILAFTETKPSVIEVLDTEDRKHAEDKPYPDEFKIIPIDVNESLDNLEGIL